VTTHECGLFAKSEAIQVVDVLSQQDVCSFAPNLVVEMRLALPPGMTDSMMSDRGKVMGRIPQPDKLSLESEILVGELTEAEAIDEALKILAATTPMQLLIMHKDPEVGSVKITMLFCQGGAAYVSRIQAAIETQRLAAVERLTDPFRVVALEAGETAPAYPKGIKPGAELDRGAITAVELLGNGTFLILSICVSVAF
jgi:hypothetical protein